MKLTNRIGNSILVTACLIFFQLFMFIHLKEMIFYSQMVEWEIRMKEIRP